MDCKKAGKVLLGAWIVFSVLFVGNSVLQKMKMAAFLEGRDAGFSQAVSKIIFEAKNEKCAYFPVVSGEEKVELLNVECLKKAEN